MLKTLQIIALVLFGGLLVEISIWASRYDDAWWLIVLPPLLVYIGILSSLFAGSSEAWLLRSARTIIQILLGTNVRSTVFCILLLPMVATFGSWLWSEWEKNEEEAKKQAELIVRQTADAKEKNIIKEKYKDTFMVQVYKNGPNNPLTEVSVNAMSIHPETTDVQQKTDSKGVDYSKGVQRKTNLKGVAYFNDAREEDILIVTIRTEHEGQLKDGAVPAFTLNKRPWYLGVDATEISGDSWSEAIEGAPPLPRTVEVASATLTSLQTNVVSSVRWPHWSGDKAFVESNAPWGLPSVPNSAATPSAEYIVSRQAFVLGFDPERRIPRWIANATRPYTGAYKRSRQRFKLDPLLPAKIQAVIEDYKGSGYDRGHLLSGRDVASHGPVASMETSYMSVVAPQTPRVNRGVWLALEKYSRDLATQHSVVYLISGTVFSLKHNEKKFDERKVNYVMIGKRRVAVPVAFYRVIGRVGPENSPEFIAFLIPNNIPHKSDFTDFTVSVDKIEALTGLDFFQDLPDEIEAHLESRIPTEVWPITGG